MRTTTAKTPTTPTTLSTNPGPAASAVLRGLVLRRAGERGHADHGWLDSRHSFSFADYHDPAWMGFRSLRVINDDTVAGGAGFGTHPHRDMEILTFVLSGALRHEDSMGHTAVLRPGDVQRISAGSGIAHSEFNFSPIEPVHFLQVWIMPNQRGVQPTYAERSLGLEARPTLTLVASAEGREGSLSIHQEADVWQGRLPAGASIQHALRPGRQAWLHLAEGELELAGETLKAGDAAAFTAGGPIEFTATRAATVLLFDLN